MSAGEHTHEHLVAVERDWSAAIVANDPDRIGSFMTNDWVIVSGRGVGSREEFLGHVRSGDLTHSAMRDTGSFRVRVYGDAGDTAVVTGRATNTAYFRGRRFDADEWVTDVFVRRDGRWKCALTHLTTAETG